MEELGFPGFEATAWFGLMAPAGTPPAIVDKLHKETVRVLALPDVKAKLEGLGGSARGQHAGRVRRHHQDRDAALGQGDQGRGDQVQRIMPAAPINDRHPEVPAHPISGLPEIGHS